MRRLYYIVDDLPTTRAISETLHSEGIRDWNFHVVAKDTDGLYRHHIHSATPIQQLDIVHTGERWALVGAALGLALGLIIYYTSVLPTEPNLAMVVAVTLTGTLIGAWQGGAAGRKRESYKLAPYHDEIEAGRYLIMVDVRSHSKARVREIMNMGFPRVRYCGKDSTLINPFKKPRRVYPQASQ